MGRARPHAAFAGAVLCGGASRRMGADKALLVVDGRAMAVRVAEALAAAGAAPVVSVGGDAAGLAAAGLEVVPDQSPGSGPLGGIVTALGATDAAVVVIAACDLLAPSPDAVATVAAALGADPAAAVAVPVVGGRRQWMHAAWRTGARAPLLAAFQAGERAVHAACAAARLRVAELALPPAAVADADTPSDFGERAPAAAPQPRSSGRRPGRGSLTSMEVPEIDVAELARVRADGAPLIDVREPDEYDTAHVPGAELIPLATVPDELGRVPSEGAVYVICARGGRSMQAAEFYRAQGIDAVNVAGGTNAWIDAGQPVSTGMEP